MFPLLLSTASCGNPSSTESGNLLSIELLKSEFDIGEDVVFNVFIGLPIGEEVQFDNIPTYAYKVAVTKNTVARFGESKDGLIILKEITKYEEGKYNYTKAKNGAITYNYSEHMIIPSEVFSEESGDFFIGIFSSMLDDEESEQIIGTMHFKCHYKIKEGKIFIFIYQNF